MIQSHDDADDDLAADFALGLLPSDQTAAAERRMEVDAAFAAAVTRWRGRFAEFDATAETPAPGPHLWSRIERDVAADEPMPRRTPVFIARFWNSLGALRIATVGATAAAVLFAATGTLFYGVARNAAATAPIYVAILISDTTRQPGAIVNTFADGHAELVPLVDMNVPAGRALQIWTLWDRAVGPRPVALIDRARSTRLDLDHLPSTAPDQLFEITLEPSAGSPIGRPTGPILYKGTTARAL